MAVRACSGVRRLCAPRACVPSLQRHLSTSAYAVLKKLKEDPEASRTSLLKRKANISWEEAVSTYDLAVQQRKAVDDLRRQQNALAKVHGKPSPAEIEERRSLREAVSNAQGKLSELDKRVRQVVEQLPNDTFEGTPLDDEPRLVRLVGTEPRFEFQVADHTTLLAPSHSLDFASGAKTSGSKFPFLRGPAARLELALVHWAVSRAEAAGFTPIATPDLVKPSVLQACGFQPRGENTQVYNIDGHDLCLAGTAEQPLAGMFMDEILAPEDLPARVAGFGHCFRTETGANATDRGLYRVHQFSKVELFAVSMPEDSSAVFQDILDFQISLFSELGLHFRVLEMPSSDLGAPAFRKVDMEAWMPGRQIWGEISSTSHCTDYQSRRLKLRCRVGPKSTAPVHTLNGTGCAVPRMMIALLETHQREDGSIALPEAIQPFMGGLSVLRP